MVAFHLEPQTSLELRLIGHTILLQVMEDQMQGAGILRLSHLRTGGANLLVDVDAKFDGDISRTRSNNRI